MTLLFNPNTITTGLVGGYKADQDIQKMTDDMRKRESDRFLREYQTYNQLFANDRYNQAMNKGLGPQQSAQAAIQNGGFNGLKFVNASNGLAGSYAGRAEAQQQMRKGVGAGGSLYGFAQEGDEPIDIAEIQQDTGNPNPMQRFNDGAEAKAALLERQSRGDGLIPTVLDPITVTAKRKRPAANVTDAAPVETPIGVAPPPLLTPTGAVGGSSLIPSASLRTAPPMDVEALVRRYASLFGSEADPNPAPDYSRLTPSERARLRAGR